MDPVCENLNNIKIELEHINKSIQVLSRVLLWVSLDASDPKQTPDEETRIAVNRLYKTISQD